MSIKEKSVKTQRRGRDRYHRRHAVGTRILGVINTGRNLLSGSHFYPFIAKGAVILVAACIDVQMKKRHG
jgi:predicted ABC-type sugar transport system permease subunit